MNTDALVRRAKTGDRDALAALCTHFHPQIFRFFRRMNLSEADSDDLAQSTLLRMMERLGDFHFLPGRRFEGWLYRIAYNLFIDFHRRPQMLPLIEDAPLPDLSACTEREVLREESVREVRQAVAELDEEMQALISMRYELEMDYRAISQALGISTGRVKWRLHDALKKLRAALEEGGGQP